MNKPYVRVLGSADWHQTAFNDHSCYTVSDEILIDACPSAVTHLLEHDVDPVNVHTICFTHMHPDHYMGLAPLLHYWRVCKNGDLSGLTILGPADTIEEYVQRTLFFVFGDQNSIDENIPQKPNIVGLKGVNTYDLAEYEIRTMDSDHAVPGLCFRITHKPTGKSVGFTGDTRYQDAFPSFFQDADLLLHEVSFGSGPLNEAVNAICRHCDVHDAIHTAQEANVRRLLLTHTYEPKREKALSIAKSSLNIPVDWAMPGNCFMF